MCRLLFVVTGGIFFCLLGLIFAISEGNLLYGLVSAFAGWGAYNAISEYRSGNRRRGSRSTPTSPYESGGLSLEISAQVESKELTGGVHSGESIRVVVFRIRGLLSNEAMLDPCFEIRLWDVTDGEMSAPRVQSVIDSQQSDNSTAFLHRMEMGRPVQAYAGSLTWTTIGISAVDWLLFPSAGKRTIRIGLRLIDKGQNGKAINSTFCDWDFFVSKGYLEFESEHSEAQGASLQLAMVMAAADGNVDSSEVKVIKKWSEKVIELLPSERKELRRNILNEALEAATKMLRAGKKSDLEEGALLKLRDMGETSFMYDAYELCLQVLSADGEAHPAEMAELTTMGQKLGLNESKVRMLTDKYTADINFAQVGGGDADDQILGITKEMSTRDIRSHLNKLYKKHEARATHSDPDKAARAKEWLERIAAARVRHIGVE